MDIAQFLIERLNEDERVAQNAKGQRWLVHGSGGGFDDDSWVGGETDDPREAVTSHPEGGHPSGSATRRTAEHIALHDPARVLADVATKRAIIALCSRDFSDDQTCDLARDTLLALAQPYLDHPDADPEWRYAAVPQRWIVGPWISTSPER